MFQSLCGDDGPLVELSVLLTFPGAAPQGLHSDIPFGKLNDDPATGLPGLASVFVALHDINMNMGPTHVLEKTHLPSFRRKVIKQRTVISHKIPTYDIPCNLMITKYQAWCMI